MGKELTISTPSFDSQVDTLVLPEKSIELSVKPPGIVIHSPKPFFELVVKACSHVAGTTLCLVQGQ